MHNLVEQPEFTPLVEELRQTLFQQLRAQGDPRIVGDGSVFDNYPYADEPRRDFYNRFVRGEIKRFITPWVNPGDFEPESITDE